MKQNGEPMNYYKLGKFQDSAKRNIVSVSYAIVTFLIFLLICEYLIEAQAAKAQAQQRIEANNYTSVLKSKVDRELNSLLFISGGLSSYLTVYHNNIEPDKVQAILADLYARSKHVRNLAVAVNFKLTYVFPIATNKQIIGLDYRDLPKQWPLVKKAVDSHEGVLAGPIDLVQGGKGLIYRYPIYIKNEYWGLLSTVIDTNQFLNASFTDTNKLYEFAIRSLDSNGLGDKAFYGDDKLFSNPDAYRTVSAVPNGKWEWAVLEKSEQDSAFPILVRLVGLIFSAFFGYTVYFFLKERNTLASHALYDSLTGLANRRLLHERMNQALLQSKRQDRHFAIMFIDIDHFKRINDTHGHDFGDELLKTVAIKLLGCIRDVDTLSRIGGDEFVIVIEQLMIKDDVNLVANKILASFVQPLSIMGTDISISLSIGIAIYSPSRPVYVKTLMKQADIALYDVKASGRNNYKIFTEAE